MKVRKFISAQERSQIEAAVAAAEANTAGEIVPAILPASADYSWVSYRAALVGWAAASLATWLFYRYRPFALELWVIYGAQALGIFLGWIFSRTTRGLHWLVPPRWFEHEVREAAESAFLRYGLTETRHRTGVLVYVSLRERRVQILADKGIHEKMGDDFWRGEAARIVAGIRAGDPAAGMCEAIRSIGEKLSAHFPRQPDDTNELPNVLRTE